MHLKLQLCRRLTTHRLRDKSNKIVKEKDPDIVNKYKLQKLSPRAESSRNNLFLSVVGRVKHQVRYYLRPHPACIAPCLQIPRPSYHALPR